jgi:hypothetical protein
MSIKFPMTPAGIEPTTSRCVAQHLKHCATEVPQLYIYYGLATCFGPHVDHHRTMHTNLNKKGKT